MQSEPADTDTEGGGGGGGAKNVYVSTACPYEAGLNLEKT